MLCRRILPLLCAMILLCGLCSCAPKKVPEWGGEEPVRMLIIGNSHSIDAFYLLHEVFQDQMPQQEVVLGVVHYSGCSISKHVLFSKYEKDYYTYLRNVDGQWETFEGWDMQSILKDQQWDRVMFQAAKTDLDDTLNEEGRRELEEYVSKYLRHPHQYLWHTSWPSPNEEIFFSPAYTTIAPEGYKENLMALYGFDPVNQFTVLTDMAKEHILTDTHYSQAVCTGASVMYAHKVLGISQLELWRDYTHLSDFGRLMVAYTLYAQLTGNKIEQVGVESIPMALRYFQYQYLGDMEVTQQMKDSILQAVNQTLDDPWHVPGK